MNLLRLGDALEVLLDHRGKTPKKLGSDFVSDGVPVASAILVGDGMLNLADARRVDNQTYEKWMPVPTRKGDVILTSEAPLGRLARVASDDPLVLGQRLYGLRGKPGVLDNGYLYYALQTERVQADLIGRSTGTTVFGIRQSALRDVRIPAPSYAAQRGIAEVLGSLDDKIAANTELASKADALARSEFERLAVEARHSGQKFADVARIGGGGTPRSKVPEFWGGAVPWLTPTDVTGLPGPYVRTTRRTISESGLASISSPLYPEGSIFMTSRATIGAFALAERPMAVNQGFIVVQPNDDRLRYWLFHEMRSRVAEFVEHANGATFMELSRGNFKKLGVRLVPDEQRMHEFGSSVAVLHARASAAHQESEQLANVRDTLLPHLMSGKLRVRDAEPIAGDPATAVEQLAEVGARQGEAPSDGLW